MKRFLNQRIVLLLLLVFSFIGTQAQDKKVKVGCIAFYNLENLFDTVDDPNVDDAEFLPGGASDWTSLRYEKKIKNMSEVIAQIGDELIKGGPSIIGLAEVENRGVLEDLINSPALRNSGYAIVHYDSPDKRGVDVGFLYKKKDFKVTASKAARLTMPWKKDFYTRDQLVVSGLFDGEPIHVIVNHWPSRHSGPEYRAEAAKLTRSLADSLLKLDANAKIFIMGDLNDDPIDPSVYKVLNAKGKIKEVKNSSLFNPMWQMFKDGIGSLAYRDSWNLFDQIIISPALLKENKQPGFTFYKAKVCNKKFLTTAEGQYAGYPYRTFAGGAYEGGYSDHFPVYLFITK